MRIGKDAHFKSEVTKAAKELVEKTRKKGHSGELAAKKKAQVDAAAQMKVAAEAKQKKKSSAEVEQKKNPTNSAHEAANKRSMAILNAKQAAIDKAKAKQGDKDVKESAEPAATAADENKDEPAADKNKEKAAAPAANKKKPAAPAAPATDKKKDQSSANPHLKQLQDTIKEFEQNVKKTLDATQNALSKQTDDVQAKRNKLSDDMRAYQTIEKMRMKATKIPVDLVDDVLLQVDKESAPAKLSAVQAKQAQLHAKVSALHKAMTAKANLQVDAAKLKEKENAAEKRASSAALKTEAAAAHTDREKFIQAEIVKARAAANLKIVNPLEAKLTQLKAKYDREHAWMVHDQAMVAKHLSAANQAATAASSEANQFAAAAVVSQNDVEASKSSALLRYSSKHSSEIESEYLAVKHEYNALQTRLEQENKRHMEKAAEAAEAKAGPAYDKVESGHAKDVEKEAAASAKALVDQEQVANALATTDPCNKCVQACKTDECAEWCKGAHCSKRSHFMPTE